ncbi:MAG: mechanosensitive ion channel family protein [Planctomycetota bacterium]
MDYRTIGFASLCLSVASLGFLPAADAPPPPPATTVAADIDLSELDLRLRPLTASELTVEAYGWLALVKEKVRALSDVEIAAKKAEGDEKTKLLDEAQKLRDEQTRATDRTKAVLAALVKKGGDAKDYGLYLDAVSGLKIEVKDTSAALTTVKNWLKSPEGGLRWAKNIVLFIVTIVIFKILAAALGAMTNRAVSTFRGTSKLLRDFLANVVRKVTVLVGFVVALSMLEVNIGPFLAAMGVAGFVIAFALQGTLSNFAAGVMILLYRPYDLGEKVTVAGQTGVVASMTLVSTVLTTDDGKVVTIPNSSVWGGVITNHSRGPGPAPAPAGGRTN